MYKKYDLIINISYYLTGIDEYFIKILIFNLGSDKTNVLITYIITI